MFTPKEKKVMVSAIQHWGVRAQTEMALEESLELALSIRKLLRDHNVNSESDMAGEIADVLIMIEQLKMMYPGLQDQINYAIIKKITRLETNLNIHK